MPTRHPADATPRSPAGLRAMLAPLAATVTLLAGLGALLAPASPSAATAPAQGWTTQEAPLPPDAGNGSTNPAVYLASSSCPTPTGCVAAGWYFDTADHPWGLIEAQSGSTWTQTEAPEPLNAGTGVHQGLWLGSQFCGISYPCQAISCPTATSCVAVGSYSDTSGYSRPVIETRSNGTWTAMEAPVPPDGTTGSPPPFGYLSAVTCSSPTACVAVGRYTNMSGAGAGLVDVLSGTTWTAVTAPAPPNPNASPSATLDSVSCPTPSWCVASGYYRVSSGGYVGLFDTLANGTWTATAAPLPGNADLSASGFLQLFQVSCPSTSFCAVSGYYRETSGNYAGSLGTFSGGSWTVSEAPQPPNASTGTSLFWSMYGVSCATTTSCVAVGWYEQSGGGYLGLIDTWSGAGWSPLQAPQPSNAEPVQASGELETVSCPTASFCMAVGFYETAGNVVTGYVDTLVAGKWSTLPAPLPPNAATSGTLNSVAKYVDCYSAVACNVVGDYSDPGNQQGFLATYTGVQGYWLDASDGGIFTYGNAQFYGSTGSLKLNQPVVGMAATADGQGYWLVAADGGIFSYGDAAFHGSSGSIRLNKPVVGMAATPDGGGYWLVASDGGIFSYGDAGFFGSRGGQPLNKPIVGMAATADGRGYWLVASDGGIFDYGDAGFFGSTGSLVLNKPVVGMAGSPDGAGYWLVASDGGIFNYGDAPFYGSTGSLVLNKPVVGMAASPAGKGYWLVASDGGIFNYGDAPFYGSAGSLVLNKPVVGMAG